MAQDKKKQITPNLLRTSRLSAKLTLSDVAFLLDIKNIGRVSEWETGTSNPSIEHLISLSLIYQRLPDRLYGPLREFLIRKLEARKSLLEQSKSKWLDSS